MKAFANKTVRLILGMLWVSGMVVLFASCEESPKNLAKGYALAIGINKINPAHYNGDDGTLYGCEPDAEAMLEIAAEKGLSVDKLLTEQATRQAVLDKLETYAETLKPGDLLVVSYSGHGGQLPDMNGDELDGLDETWCLYDGQLIDDELQGAWMKFRPGVRILIFSDSCHSGTVLKMLRVDMERNMPEVRKKELETLWKVKRVPQTLDRAKLLELPAMHKALRRRPELLKALKDVLPPKETSEYGRRNTVNLKNYDEEDVFVSRLLPPSVMVNTYQMNKEFYDARGNAAPKEDPMVVQANVLLISGCEDDQPSMDLGFNGLFTAKLKETWNNGNFTGNHMEFHKAIQQRVLAQCSIQSPCFTMLGMGTQKFAEQTPYDLNP